MRITNRMTEQSDLKYWAPTNRKEENSKYHDPNKNNNMSEVTKPTSLSTLIIWNISKALEKNPSMNIKGAITAVQGRLEGARDVSAMLADCLEERHLACALLAWQQLGHSDTDSLCQFIENRKKKEQECASSPSQDSTQTSLMSSRESKYSKDVYSMSFGSNSVGPVVKLPVDTKIVMRMETSPSARHAGKKPKAPDDTMNKIDAACCMDSACAQRLAAMDTATAELRSRAGMLARREAERVELLERAEAAWKDLELGYQRRLTLAEEKEDDLTSQIQKAIEERNGFKNACTTLAQQLREKGDKAEKDRASLSAVEKDVCSRACLRLRLSEESAKADALLAEHQCRAAQLDRELQFKEEQARRKLLNFRSELESSQTITLETERAIRAELSALRDQVTQVAEQLLQEDTENAQIKIELEDLRQEKSDMVEDLEGCKGTCDGRMQGKVDDLKKKRDRLIELKDIVTECRCKMPVDATVEVKRTASLAALCRCTPEEKIYESCSCTSLRSSLLSNLLSDLFSGLQAEMGGTGAQMPCELLKCLEDKHNWDRASIVKTNLKNYFSQLLIKELDIAIAISIENYHAKWVGQSCADVVSKMKRDPGEAENEGWQQRAIERRAQTLATKLAEQLFEDRAEELTQHAVHLLASEPPPCECNKPANNRSDCCKEEAAAVFPVIVEPVVPVNGPITTANTPAYWHQTLQDVTQLRMQIEDLKKDSIKKEDLAEMEDKIKQIVQLASDTEKHNSRCHSLLVASGVVNEELPKKETKIYRAVNSSQSNNTCNSYNIKKKQPEPNCLNKKVNKIMQSSGLDNTVKPNKKYGHTYSINMCMCALKKPNKMGSKNKMKSDSYIQDSRGGKGMTCQIPNCVKQTKPINSSLQSQDISTRSHSKTSEEQLCGSNCKCFNKIPSTTSIDKLLETLTKWKSDLRSSEISNATCCNFAPGRELNQSLVHNDSSVCCKKGENDNQHQNKNKKQKEPCPNNLIKEEATSKKSSRSSMFEPDVCAKHNAKHKNKTKRQDISNATCCNFAPGVELKQSLFQKTSSVCCKKGENDKQYQNNNQNQKRTCPNNLVKEETTSKKSSKSSMFEEHDVCAKHNAKYKNKTKLHNECSKNNICDVSKSKDKAKINKTVSYDSKMNQTKTILDTDFAPGTTESEYMGAINLDKSNEDFCKCKSCLLGDQFKCNTTDKCSCKSIVTNKDKIQAKETPGIDTDTPGQRKVNVMKYLNNKSIPYPRDSTYNYVKSKNAENLKKKTGTTQQDGYDIQFLGVTLTDVNTQKKTESVCHTETDLTRNNNIKNDVHYCDCNANNKDADSHVENSLDESTFFIQDSRYNKSDQQSTNKQRAHIRKKKYVDQDELVQETFYFDAYDKKEYSQKKCFKQPCINNNPTINIRHTNENQDEADGSEDINKDIVFTQKTESDQSKNNKQRVSISSVKLKEESSEKICAKCGQNDNSNTDDVSIQKPCKSNPVCECNINIDNFEKLIEIAFPNQQTNEDKSIDTQSFQENKNDNESCVCCNKQNADDQTDLEKNAFHLLGEHLKKKLEEFKESSCNSTCIPHDEEEKLFSTILQRVKQVINDSTNKIICKCSNAKENSKGSWDRAYGLLQEYLKTKLKRVQCSCVSVEDNDNTILPEVLDQVCNLIEHDFQRLKDVCGCKKDQAPCERDNNKQVYFKEDIPVRDTDFKLVLDKKQTNKCIAQSPYASVIIKQNISSQVPSYLGMEIKSCNSTYTKDIQTTETITESIKSLESEQECNCTKKVSMDAELIGKDGKIIQTSELIENTEDGENCNKLLQPMQFPHVGYAAECVCKGIECTLTPKPNNIDSGNSKIPQIDENLRRIEHKLENNVDAELLGINKNITKQQSEPARKNHTLNEAQRAPTDPNINKIENNTPYIGYTIDCSCNNALGACVCAKSVSQADNDLITDIYWSKSIPNDKYYQKVSYIMKSNPTDNNTTHSTYLSEMVGDLYLQNILKHKTLYDDPKQDCETEVSIQNEEGLTLKGSKEYFDTAHITTNTFDDNVSVNTDYSNTDAPLDWCECCSQLPPHDVDSEQLKRSIYFPIPLGNFGNNLERDVKNTYPRSVPDTLPKHCDCDMVPICHVKMLVENIENKLANSKCTCDSMISKVCPIHSAGW